mgnify:CR=1 FL=1
MKRAVSLILAGSLALSLAACGGPASSTSTTASSAAGTTLTGKGDGFGGVITATVTMEATPSPPSALTPRTRPRALAAQR